MSKLRGNVLSPLDAIQEYGTDSLRFALSTGISPGNDIRLSPQKMEAGRNFANKLWNATRFVVRTVEANPGDIIPLPEPLPLADRWIRSRLNRLIAKVNSLLENFHFGEAERQIHDFLWGEYCDWYIEMAKLRSAPSPIPTLVHVLDVTLRLLHPFMPFITEELWQNLKRRRAEGHEIDSIMIAPYPVSDNTAIDPKAEREMEAIIEIIGGIRNARAQYKVEPARRIEAQIYAGQLDSAIASNSPAIETLARVSPLTIDVGRREKAAGDDLVLVLKETDVVLPLAGMVDLEAERHRLEREIEGSRAELSHLEARLRDESFLTKAPAEVVKKEQGRRATHREKLERLEAELSRLPPS
jgi:valyl-tRNA synthetase